MARGIGFGQYLDTESPIHALDARTKVVGALATMISLFCIHTPAQLILGLAFIIAVTLIARIGIKRALEATSYVLVMILILAVINLFLTTSGTPLVELGFIRITDDGVTAAVLYSLRLIIGVLAALVLHMTTTPARLTDAFDALLSPFGKIGLPAHSIAMVFSLMLRFIPTIGDEAAAIVDAQRARGGSFSEGSFSRRIQAIVSVIVALIASCLNHATNLARALDARCYEDGGTRTHWHPMRFTALDAVAFVVIVAYVCALVVLGL